jgi:hypothetical protein
MSFAATAAPWRLGKVQKITVGASSTASTAFGAGTQAIMVTCLTANCHIAVGLGPGGADNAATANDYLLKTTDISLVLGCRPGEKIAVIQDTGAAVLYVAELSR